MTAQELIKASMRLVGALATGETPTDPEITDGLLTLNGLIKILSIERLIIPFFSTVSFPIPDQTGTYTIGSGGDINTERPKRVVNAYIRDTNNTDTPLDIISREEYNDIIDKTITGQATELFYDDSYPLGTINLQVLHSETSDTLYLDLWQALSTLALKTSVISFPEEYEQFLIYNLVKIKYNKSF